MTTRRTFLRLALLGGVLALALPGCGKDVVRIRLATTTSFRDTGLSDVLLAEYRKDTGVEVQAVAVGTGEALKLGERGDADVVLVHARKAEDEFMAKGFGVERHDLWWNRFLIVGPAADPAGLAKATGARDALARLRDAKALFVSRGDDSGTHKREKELWGADPKTSRYEETGQGQGPTLLIASELEGYTLTDEGTYLRMRSKLALVPLVTNDPLLRNPYGVILVRVQPGREAVHAEAKHFADWLAGPRARALVEGFRIDGQRPFFLPGEEAPAEASPGAATPK